MERENIVNDIVKKSEELEELEGRLKSIQKAIALIKTEITGRAIALGMLGDKEEGSKSDKFGPFKLTLSKSIERTLDLAAYKLVMPEIPEWARCVNFKTTASIDMKKLRTMDEARPGFSAQFITTKPGKCTVKIERVKE